MKMEGPSNAPVIRKNNGLISLSCWYNYETDSALGKVDPLAE